MISGSLTSTSAAEKVNPRFKQVFDYIKTKDFVAIPATERIEIKGNEIFCSINEYQGKSIAEAKLEAHRKYIDIHIPVIGIEKIGFYNIDKFTDAQVQYNEEKDVVLYNYPVTSFITITPGEFVIFFPEDVHAPGVGEGFKKKIVVKVLVL